MKLLHLDSSILGDHSVSRRLTAEVVEAFRLGESQVVDTVYRDLAAEPVPLIDATLLAARARPADQRSADEQALVARADAVLAEFLAAETLVIGAPMYNFALPAQLKAWIDLITVAGVTFRYGAHGAEGLATVQRAIIVATAGGQHAGQPSGEAHADYLQRLLKFLGVADVRVITAEGLAMGDAVRAPALEAARAQIAALG